MTTRSVSVLAAALALAAAPALAQAPRASDGHPDLTGVWSNASLTQLERAPGARPTMTEAEAKALARAAAQRTEADSQPTDPSKGAPPATSVVAQGFNNFWADSGDSLARVKGEYRTSWIVEPADGRLPLTDLGRTRFQEAAVTRGLQTPDGPEQLSPNDRCIIGSRGSGGPAMLNNVYNSHYQIVQTPGAVAIVAEMVHDARAIPILPSKAAAQAAHGPAAMQRWLGDSVAWWEGEALVVETINVNPQQGRFGPVFLSAQGRVTERLTRLSPTEIFYEFRVEDPVHYTQAWRAEMTLSAIKGPVYEYACHEGNYAMPGILAGARAERAKTGGGS